MIREYEKVKIKSSGINGVVIDIFSVNGVTHYTVESDERGTQGGYGDNESYKLYDCTEAELEVV